MTTETPAITNFIRDIVNEDLRTNKWSGRVVTRFPPEPNGYLHIGHAKSICINFGIARDYHGTCHLRFDDTNPTKEEVEYIESIKEDVRWLGFDWGQNLFYASDYFEQLYDFAVLLIQKGKAYVCQLSGDEIRSTRGTLTQPGTNSPYRDRSIEENLDLFSRMRQGEFDEGSCVLRAKIDMTSPNINLRDPIIYRILKSSHHRTGDTWCIYPMYDFAHCFSDSIERITHSICTLEFEDHRPLYDWCLNTAGVYHPQQIEFARLNLNYTVMSKRKLLKLVQGGFVSGWDDPRMFTISGLRRRGLTPESIRSFCDAIGVAKSNSTVDISLLEFCIREDLNLRAKRVMAVLKPIKLVITNFPEGTVENIEAENNPEDPAMGTRTLPFTRELFIEREDFMENPPAKYFRLAPGKEVRLKYAYYVTCTDVLKDPATGEIKEIHATYDPETKGGWSKDGRKVKGTLHWVSSPHAFTAEVRIYDHLFTKPVPGGDTEDGDYLADLNPNSLEVFTQCRMEPSLKEAQTGVSYQFLRHGYFCVDSKDSKPSTPIFNRTVALKDSWAKIEKKG